MVTFFCSIMYTYIYHLPFHSYFSKMKPELDFINLLYLEQTYWGVWFCGWKEVSEGGFV